MSVAQPPGKQFGLLCSAAATDLADEIQGIAARQFLPRIDHRIDRERMHQFGSAATGKVWVIANGDFLRCPENWPPSQYIRPLWVGLHISSAAGSEPPGLTPQEAMLTPPAVKYLKGYGPVGARDAHTLDLLRQADVESCFSGCLSLTLERPPVARDRDLIVLNDVPEQIAELIRQRALKAPREVSHADPPKDSDARHSRAKELLETYARAGCVITTRVHCAVPCLAFDTPVLLLVTAENRLEVSGLEEFVHHCTADEFLAGRVAFDLEHLPSNPDRHASLAQALRARVAAFIDIPETADPHPDPLSLSDRYAIIAANQARRLSRQPRSRPPGTTIGRRSKTVLLQTSDAHVYAPILQETARVNRAFCARHGLEYQCFIGLKRGYHPWQATFNRIPLLLELQQAGDVGWVLFLDADAYVYEVGFDVQGYLAENQNSALIVAPGSGVAKWDVNAGVMFINLQHPLGRKLVDRWGAAFANAMSDADLRLSIEPWSAHVDDQSLLQDLLRQHRDILDATRIEAGGLINYEQGRFVRQILRSTANSMPLRIQRAAIDVQAALSSISALPKDAIARPPIEGAANGSWFSFLFEAWRPRCFSLLYLGAFANLARDDTSAAELEAAHFAALRRWTDYFCNAHCFDVNAISPDDEELSRISFIRSDRFDAARWSQIARRVPALGLIFDGAALGPDQQQRAFLALFRRMLPGGHYVIDPCGEATGDLFLGYLQGGSLGIDGADPSDIDECARSIGHVYIDREISRAASSGSLQRLVIVARN